MNIKPYLISGIIGNSRILACLDKQGKIERMFWPQLDYPQHVRKVVAGLFFSQQHMMLWLDQPEWEVSQAYQEDTNILVTKFSQPQYGLQLVCEDFVLPERDILIRHFRISNTGKQARKLQFCYYSDLLLSETDRYQTTVFDFTAEALIQYKRKVYIATGASRVSTGYQCGGSWETISQGILHGNDHGMGSDGTLLWDMGQLEVGQDYQLTVFVCCGCDRESVLSDLAWVRAESLQALRKNTINYWQKYLQQAKQLKSGFEAWDQLYQRSLLVFRLVTDDKYGSILAAPEVDEYYTRCGGYAYCWVRDAAYITAAYDIAGLTRMSRQFYLWVLGTQGADGSTEQRYYLDGSTAPNWGLQIDEAGSAVWGMWQHYLIDPDQEFLLHCWPYVVRAAEFMLGFLDADTGLPRPSMDLWEERMGVHTYSAAAVWGGIYGAAEMARLLGKREKSLHWQKQAEQLRESILSRLWNKEEGRFFRGTQLRVSPDEFAYRTEHGEKGRMIPNPKGYPVYFMSKDTVIDISLLGLTVPFGLLPAEDERMQSTARAIEEALTSPEVGGLKRYVGDNYIGGNPWVLATLWLALYYIELKNYSKARQLVEWVVRHQTSLGLLPEQVDKHTAEPAWVIPLTWSHAMYVLAVQRLQQHGT